MVRSRAMPALLLMLFGAGCGPAGDAGDGAAAEPVRLEHDFGTIPHGQQREHTFELTGVGAGWTPIGFRSACSCGSARFLILERSGAERELGGLSHGQRVLRRDERLLLRLTIDTRLKEAVDQRRLTMRGTVELERAGHEGDRQSLEVVFHFAIDAPIEVSPRPHVDFGALPRSRSYSQTLELHPDRVEPAVAFGPVATSDPHLSAALREEAGIALLDLRFDPRGDVPPGPVRLEVRVGTDLEDGYVLHIPVTGAILPDIVVDPFAHMGFGRFDLATPAERFVNVYDHDLGRDPAFVVLSITDPHGVSLADHFDVDLQPLRGEPRCTRLYLRYKGTLRTDGFRGTIVLAKPGGHPRAEITFVGFHRKP